MKKTNEDIFRGLHELNYFAANTILIGLTDDSHASISFGASDAPNMIRKLSTYFPPVDAKRNRLNNTRIFDYGNVISGVELQEKVSKVLNDQKFLVVLGGDHAIAIHSEKSFIEYALKNNKEPVVFHFDAHADICAEYQNDKMSHACVNYQALENGLKPENLVMLGIRSYEEQEVLFLNKNPKIRVIDAFELHQKPVQAIVDELKKKYQGEEYIVYLSFDIDMIDPSFAPGTGTPETFGIHPLYARELLEKIIQAFDVRAIDFVEVNPQLDTNNITSWVCLKLLYEVLSAKQSEKL